jgi:hypothetical protein
VLGAAAWIVAAARATAPATRWFSDCRVRGLSTLGDEQPGEPISACAEVPFGCAQFSPAIDCLFALGGTAVNTGSTHAVELRLPVHRSALRHGIEQIDRAGRVQVSETMRTLAVSPYKITNDIRLMWCGPRTGFAELPIPENEAGSSIMPGEVNRKDRIVYDRAAPAGPDQSQSHCVVPISSDR